MRDGKTLAGSLLPGDHLISATMSGTFDAEVLGISPPRDGVVDVVLAGAGQPVSLCVYEVCCVRRAESIGTPSERAGWVADAAAAEVTS